jgi:hypothetical protein
MTWTYASSSTTTTDLSWVRVRIGDTSSGDQLLQDEEINAFVDSEGNREMGAALAAEAVGAQFARKVDKSVGKLRIAFSQASEHYFGLAKRLRREVAIGAGPYAGGISRSDKEANEADTDVVEPAFRIGQFDRAGAANDPDWST